MRLFAAIRPPGYALDHLARALELVGSGGVPGGVGPVRWTSTETWHLTVAFYGEVPDGAVDELRAALERVAARTAPFTLALRGSGIFAHHTVWVGTAGDVDAAATLARAATEAGGTVTGWADDRERSRPHLTVGRVLPATLRRTSEGRRARAGGGPGRGPRRRGVDAAVTDLVRALAVYQGPGWRASELLLVASAPGRGAVRRPAVHRRRRATPGRPGRTRCGRMSACRSAPWRVVADLAGPQVGRAAEPRTGTRRDGPP